ncbi:MAG: hypothetical protein QW291_01460 [Thermofilaceae archaeon]
MKLCLYFLLVLLISACAAGLPQGRYGDTEIFFNSSGTVVVQYYALRLVGQIVTWGPGWLWDEDCGAQSSWAPGELRENTFTGLVTCSYGEFQWSEQIWVGDDYILVEICIEASTDTSFEDVAWIIGLPIQSFSGGKITAVMPYGGAQDVTLRAEYISGEASLGPGSQGAGWVLPFGTNVGLVTTIFSDVSLNGPYLDITDDREWNGTTYGVRHILYSGSDRLLMKPGDKFVFYIYLQPYIEADQLENMKRRILDVVYLLNRGLKAEGISKYIIAGRLEAAAKEAQSQQQTLLAVYAVVAAAVITVLVYLTRKSARLK